MKSFVKSFGIIVLAAVIVFSMVSCNNSSGGGSGGGSGYLQDKLDLSGKVYTEVLEMGGGINYTYREYTGANLTIDDYYGGSGTVIDGKLNYSIGTPNYLYTLDFEDYFDFDYDDISSSNTGIKGFFLEELETTPSGYLCKKNEKITVGNGSVSGTTERVYFVYVDNDVTVSGKGKTETDTDEEGTWTNKTKDFTLKLKSGWNAVYYKESFSGTFKGTVVAPYDANITDTITLSLSNPSLKWVLEVYDDDDDDDFGYSPSMLSRSIQNVAKAGNSRLKTLLRIK